MTKEKKSDSVTHHEDRHDKMQREAAAQRQTEDAAQKQRDITQDERKRKTREDENQELEQQAGLVKHGETREMLLERIRKMRAEPGSEPAADTPVFRSEGMQKQFDEEQEAGRAAVAKAAAEAERFAQARATATEAEGGKK